MKYGKKSFSINNNSKDISFSIIQLSFAINEFPQTITLSINHFSFMKNHLAFTENRSCGNDFSFVIYNYLS